MTARLNFLTVSIDGPIDWPTIGGLIQQAFLDTEPEARAAIAARLPRHTPAVLPAPGVLLDEISANNQIARQTAPRRPYKRRAKASPSSPAPTPVGDFREIKRRGRPPKAAPAADGDESPAVNARTAAREERLSKIEGFIEKVGSATAREIMDGCGIPNGSMTSLMRDPRFRKTEDGSYRVD